MRKSSRAAVSNAGRDLRSAHEALKENKDIVLAAIRQDVRAVKCAQPELMKDKEFVGAAVELDCLALFESLGAGL